MCDTFLYKKNGFTLFAKNSDREPNEAQAILHVPRKRQVGPTVRCTYIEVPQVNETFEVLLSKPFQMWGAEMGINGHGVVIGNEAVFTKIKEPKKNTGLTGMDMIRLALERCASAEKALELICVLIEKYGQDACGGYRDKNFFYHNSFIIADAEKAFKLETAGRHWAFQEIKNYDSISNGLTIENNYDGISKNAIQFAQHKKWNKTGNEFSFRAAYSARLYTHFSRCKIRRMVTFNALKNADLFSVKNAIDILQSHDVENNFNPAKATASCICMHPTGPLNPSQSNGSMIVRLEKGKAPEVHLTGTSIPCLSIYKPWRLGEKINIGISPGAAADNSLWWQVERVHRLICRDYKKGKKIHEKIFDGFQEFIFKENKPPQITWDLYREKITQLNKELIAENIFLKSKNPFYVFQIERWKRAAGL